MTKVSTVDRMIEAAQHDPVWWIENCLGVNLWEKQREICYSVRDHKYTCVQSGHNVGKGLALNTLVPSIYGLVEIQNLRVGDVLFDENGDQCRVTYKAPIRTDLRCYEVTFRCGTKVTVDEDHLWYVENDAERRLRARNGVKRPGKVRQMPEIVAAFNSGPPKRGAHIWSVPVAGGWKGLKEQKYPIDPYAYGVWLGDGYSARGSIVNADPEVWKELHKRGYDLKFTSRAGKAWIMKSYRLHKELKDAGLLHRKRAIAPSWFSGSREQRLDLLCGLLDTDGCCGTAGKIEFCSTVKELADAVYFLASSLGMKPNRPSRSPSMLYGVRKKDRYRVVFSAPFPVFKIARKAARQKTPALRSKHNMIVDIREVPSVPTQCIAVDSPSRLYQITEACIPTHNTFVTACICLWFHCCFPDSVVITTANGWGQVKGVLWEEMRKLAKRATYPLGIDFKPKHPEARCGNDNWMFGFSPDKPDSVQGHHRDNILIVFDEAQGIQENLTWDAFSSMMTSAGARQLVIGNPLYATGPFREKFRNPNWSQIQMSCLDHPNYKMQRQVIPGALTYESIEEIRRDPLRAPGTEYWDVRIAGVFPALGSDTLLPEYYLRRNADLPENKILLPGRYIGFDPAEFGTDRSVAVVLAEGHVVHVEAWRNMHPIDSVTKVLRLAAEYRVPQSHINYDKIGGVGANLRNAFDIASVPAHGVAVGMPAVGDWGYFFTTTDPTLEFLNRRAELHWAMRRLFEEGKIRVPHRYYQNFMMESSKLRYGFNQRGQLWIESKNDKFRKREGYSPDHNDALVLALARDQVVAGGIPGSARIIDDPTKVDPSNRFGVWKPETKGAYKKPMSD